MIIFLNIKIESDDISIKEFEVNKFDNSQTELKENISSLFGSDGWLECIYKIKIIYLKLNRYLSCSASPTNSSRILIKSV